MAIFKAVTAAICMLALTSIVALGADAEDQRHHAVSLIDTPKYPANYKHFDYVNPDAPKGGSLRLSAHTPCPS